MISCNSNTPKLSYPSFSQTTTRLVSSRSSWQPSSGRSGQCCAGYRTNNRTVACLSTVWQQLWTPLQPKWKSWQLKTSRLGMILVVTRKSRSWWNLFVSISFPSPLIPDDNITFFSYSQRTDYVGGVPRDLVPQQVDHEAGLGVMLQHNVMPPKH